VAIERPCVTLSSFDFNVCDEVSDLCILPPCGVVSPTISPRGSWPELVFKDERGTVEMV